MTTTTTTTLRRGAVVTLPDGTETRVLSMRGGYVHTSAGTFAPWQVEPQDVASLPPPAPDPAASARAFLDTQSQAMREWSNAALPNRREHEAALHHIAALLRLVEERERRPHLNER